MDNILTVMVVLLILVVVGYVARKLGYMDGEFDKKLSNIVIDITAPALILSSVMGKELPDRHLILPLLGVGVMTYVLLTVASLLISPLISKDKVRQGIVGFMLVFGNVGFIGYPVAQAVFGPEAVFYAAVINFSNTLFIFTLGVWQVSGDKEKIKLRLHNFLNPGLAACYTAIVICVLQWHVPSFVGQTFTYLGNITVPGALLIIGSSMAQIPLRKMVGTPMAYAVALFRLLLLPVGLYFLMLWLGIDAYVVRINTVIVAMPVATFGVMFCRRYGRDTTLMTEGTFVTTALSVLTLPLLTLLF